MAANTSILIKRSSITDRPISLAAGELAYSYSSNVIFIGTPNGTGVVNVGGQFYTAQIDAATDANTAGTIVKRDANRGFYGALYGNANTATQLLNAQNFSIDGLDVEASTVSFDGSGAVVLQGNLKTTGVTAGTYGGQTQIPVFTVDDKGRLSSAANVSVATTLSFAGDSGSGTLDLLTDTLTIVGGQGITSTANDTNNSVLVEVDDTVVRSNTPMSIQTIDGDIQISGNLVVSGQTTTINVQTLNIADPLLYLAGNNYSSDIVDIGFVGNYFDGTTQRHAGVYRHAGDKQFYVFDNYDTEPEDNLIDPSNSSFRLATLHTNLTSDRANVDVQLTLGGSSQLYANGGAYFGGTPMFYAGAESEDTFTLNSGNYLDFKTGDNTSTASIYNNGGSGLSVLELTSPRTVMTGNTVSNGYLLANNDIFAPNLPNATTQNLVYFDTANGRFSYANDNILTPTSIRSASNSYYFQIADSGLISTNATEIELANGAKIKDTTGNAVAFGENAGTLSQGVQAVAIGDSAGYNTQGAYAVAIGYGAGNISQSQVAVAIGLNAGMTNQGYNGIAIGNSAGNSQGTGAIAFGYSAGSSGGNYSVAIGHEAAKGNTTPIGANAIALGYLAGYETAVAGSIILNASGSDLSSTAAGLYINPVRYTNAQDATYDGLMFYNSSTKEVRYSYALDGGSF